MGALQTHKGYQLRHDGERFYTHKSRPYDDAEYYWACSYDGEHWAIIYNGRKAMVLTSTFERVVDVLDRQNQRVKPNMIHL